MRIALLFVVFACMAQQAPPAPKKAVPAAPPADAGAAMDSLGNALQDLNAIRDGNLSRIQAAGCPAETAARLAELRLKLAKLSGESTVDTQSLAANWFKRPVPPEADASAREASQLAEVLPGSVLVKTTQTKASEDEIARLRSEIAKLSATCVAGKK